MYLVMAENATRGAVRAPQIARSLEEARKLAATAWAEVPSDVHVVIYRCMEPLFYVPAPDLQKRTTD